MDQEGKVVRENINWWWRGIDNAETQPAVSCAVPAVVRVQGERSGR